MKKDIQERNHLVKWGMATGLLVFTLLAIGILFVDFEFLRNSHITADEHLRAALFLAAGIFTAIIVKRFIYYLAYYLNRAYLRRFKENPILANYEESSWRIFSPYRKAKHAVLLLHGFTASPQEFQNLFPILEQEELAYYAPNIPGFGINSTRLLQNVRYNDWFREGLDFYDHLSMLAEKVSIVGHSMGAVLAIFIAQQRQVNQLILSAPGLFVVEEDIKYKKILLTPLLSNFYSWLIPFLPKRIRAGRKTAADMLDYSVTPSLFQYLAVPVNCIIEIFKAQESIDIKKVNCKHLSVLYGKHDLTIDNTKFKQYLLDNHIVFDEYVFDNTAHNVFEDYDRKEACELVAQILRENK